MSITEQLKNPNCITPAVMKDHGLLIGVNINVNIVVDQRYCIQTHMNNNG